MALDIGPESAQQFAARLLAARTVFWNGPMGVFELAPFAEGTRAVAKGLIDSGAFTVIGGGDTTAAIRALGFAAESFGYLSTGGGASLDYLEGRELPGLTALQDARGAGHPPADVMGPEQGDTGWCLRALIRHLDRMPEEEVVTLNVATAVPMVYELDDDLRPVTAAGMRWAGILGPSRCGMSSPVTRSALIMITSSGAPPGQQLSCSR